MLERSIEKKLLEWKNEKHRKPLILKWARQVGKSFIVKYFWEKEFNKIFEVNFQSNKGICKIFDDDISPDNIIKKIEYVFGEKINLQKDHLIEITW